MRRLVAALTVLGIAELVGVLLVGSGARVLDDGPWLPVLIAALVGVLAARGVGLHRRRLRLSTLEDLPGLAVVSLAATAVLVVASQLVDGRGLHGAGRVTAFAVVLLLALVATHALVHGVTRGLRRAGRLRRVVVVGCGASGRRLALTLLARPEFGLAPVGFLSTGDDTRTLPRGLPLTLLGPATGMHGTLGEARADAIVAVLPDPATQAELAVVEECLRGPLDVYAVAAHVAHPLGTRSPHERVGGLAVVRLDVRSVPAAARAAHRLTEVVVAVAGLLVLVPVGAVIALLVRVETGGVFVRRPRSDEDGVPSATLRFRTRRARSLARPGTTWSVAISGRVGPVGRVLRWTRLDHLPELVRFLAGRLRRTTGQARGPAAWSDPMFWSTAPARGDESQIGAGQLTR